MITIVLPTFNEENNITVLHKRLDAVASNLQTYHFQFLFIDDCSTDRTPQILQQLHEKDNRVRIIRFARNCGSHAAITAGLTFCRGDSAIVMAADLQDPPELIGELLEAWEQKAQIVWGVRTKRVKETVLTKIFSRLYYFIMNRLTDVQMPPLGTDVFLADQKVIKAFREVTEKHTSVFMTLAWLGFKQASVEYIKEARYSGKSKWTLRKKIKLTIDSILAFSDIPIRYMSVLGVFTAFLGFLYAISVFWKHLNGFSVEGGPSLIAVVLLVGGVQMIMLGILGEYLWRTFDESRRRPRYILEYGLPQDPESWSIKEGEKVSERNVS